MLVYPIFIPFWGCPFQCVYCEQKLITGKNKLAINEKAIADFCRIHQSEEKEIAFFGGTFTNLPFPQQQELIKKINDIIDENTGIRISTRPDCLKEEELLILLQSNVTTIELGIQSFSDDVLRATQRGYDFETAKAACNLVKKIGFNLGIQLMAGLPGSCIEDDYKSIDHTIALKPSYVRLYPTIVLKNTQLAEMYYNNKYQPLNIDETIDYLVHAIKKIEKANIKVIKIGLHSDIGSDDIIAGPYHPTIGEFVKSEILKEKIIAAFQNKKTLVYSVKDESLFKGFQRKMIKNLKEELNISEIKVKASNKVKQGCVLFSSEPYNEIW